MDEQLRNLEHAFWDLVALLADNLPEASTDDDDETVAYVFESRDRFENDKEEFDHTMKEIRKQVGHESR